MPLNTRAELHPATHGWRDAMIRRAAYIRSLNRGFQPGKELEDWLAAEQEIDHLIACGAAPYC
jgi:nicotinamidase-related amidase